LATRLKRLVALLKKNNVMSAGGYLSRKIDEELDEILEENLKL
jgi:hypothetical protein